MKIELIKRQDLKLYDKNARVHPKKQIDLLVKNIKRFGFTTPLLVDKNNEVIAGHGRIEAGDLIGMAEYPCVRLENLTEKEVQALRLADNQIASLAEWDLDLALPELKGLDIELQELTGFDKELLIEPEERDDEVPEVPETPRSVLGDLYELPASAGGYHRVLCGDSTMIDQVEKLMNGKKADMVFTDPPYGVDYTGGIQFTKEGAKTNQRQGIIADDSENIYSECIPIMALYCDGAIYTWFAGTKAETIYKEINKIGDIHSLIIWVKNGGYGALNANYKQKHEPCLYWKNKKGKLNFCGKSTETTIWEINKDGINNLHPTQKPVELASKAILNHVATSVLDLFLGSGSTLIACEKTKRLCYGMELDPHYADVIVQRYVNYSGNTKIKLNGKEITWNKTEAQ